MISFEKGKGKGGKKTMKKKVLMVLVLAEGVKRRI
jgi:hypothetical protein